MKLLSDNEKKALFGDLSSLGLPAEVGLYLSTGIPQVFRLTTGSSGEPWLYVPFDQLNSLRLVLVVEANSPRRNHLARTPVSLDEHDLYFVLLEGTIGAVISLPRGTALEPEAPWAPGMMAALASGQEAHIDGSMDTAAVFVARLFSRDQSLSGFVRELLNLVTSRCPGSYAGVYYADDDSLKLRLAMGEIGLSDRLPNRVLADMAHAWTDSMQKGGNFVPGDLLPAYPVFLSEVPCFVFVHPSVRSARAGFVLAMAVPGGLDRASANRLLQAAYLASQLDESQFCTSLEMLELFTRLEPSRLDALSLDDVLIEMFRLLESQLEISRLSLVSLPGDSQTVQRTDGTVSVTVEGQVNIPPDVFKSLREGNLCLSPGPRETEPRRAGEISTSAQDKWSELYFPMVVSGDRIEALTMTSPMEADQLWRFERLIATVASYVRLCRSLRAGSTCHQKAIGVAPGRTTCEQVLDRFTTIRKLADGYFHHFSGALSVVVGQAEILTRAVSSQKQAAAGRPVVAGADKISLAADEMSSHLGTLREHLTFDRQGFARDVSCRRFLQNLPCLIHGYARHIKDTRNIALRAIFEPGHGSADLILTYAEVYDYVLPFVLALMEEAVCSGVLNISLEGRPKAGVLALEFSPTLIAPVEPAEFVQRVYKYDDFEFIGQDAGRLAGDNLALAFSRAGGDTYRLTFCRPGVMDPSVVPVERLRAGMDK